MSMSKWKRKVPKLAESTKNEGKVLTAFELIHRYDLDSGDLKEILNSEGNCEDVDEDVFERLKIEGRYRMEHERMKVKVRDSGIFLK